VLHVSNQELARVFSLGLLLYTFGTVKPDYLKLANRSVDDGNECNADSHYEFLPQKPCSTTAADMQQCMCIALDNGHPPDLVRAS
jgi:hypothetical protein